MGRMVIFIPRMYTKGEFRKLINLVPEDYEEKHKEFWDYVEEKLTPMVKHVNKVYHETVDKGGPEGLESIRKNFCERNYRLVLKLLENGAELMATEDQTLIMETDRWLSLARSQPELQVTREMYLEALEERDRYIGDTAKRTLPDEQTGIIFLEPSHEVDFPEDVKIIRMCPFNPADYLIGWMRKLKLQPADLKS